MASPVLKSSPLGLAFLRPLALPRPSTLNRFLGVAKLSTASAQSATSESASTTASAEASHSSSSSSTAAQDQSSPSQDPSSQFHSPKKPYLVRRSHSNNLPVYLLNKRGGNLKQTKLRKIEGNISALRTDLQEALGLEKGDVVVNQLTQQIIIKVRRIREIWILSFKKEDIQTNK
jgi:large subunit ribosomal protein L49